MNLVFNNAGIGGGGSMLETSREEWEKTFNVCWNGVYFGTRVFLPMLVASDEGHLVNTSSVNGFWASLGPATAHTAYSAAKFAVKGFTEALLEDFRINAPHIQVAVVMPGHIGTNIVANTMRIQTGVGDPMIDAMSDQFRDNAPMSAAAAATRILDGVRANEWRILVGDDAARLDRAVRADPLAVYGADGLSLAGIVGAVEDVLGAEPAPG